MFPQPWRVDGKTGQREAVCRQRLAPRLELRGRPIHAGGLTLPTARRMAHLRRPPKSPKGGGNGAVNGAVADLVASELVSDGLAEAVAVGRGQRQGGVVHSKRLIVGKSDRHGNSPQCDLWWRCFNLPGSGLGVPISGAAFISPPEPFYKSTPRRLLRILPPFGECPVGFTQLRVSHAFAVIVVQALGNQAVGFKAHNALAAAFFGVVPRARGE